MFILAVVIVENFATWATSASDRRKCVACMLRSTAAEWQAQCGMALCWLRGTHALLGARCTTH